MAGIKDVVKEVDISEEPDSPKKQREFHVPLPDEDRQVDWDHFISEDVGDEHLHRTCALINQAWHAGFVFSPQAFETLLVNSAQVLGPAADAAKLKKHRISRALADNFDVVLAVWHCKLSLKAWRLAAKKKTTGAEWAGEMDHYSALKICPQLRKVYHYNSISGHVDKRFVSFGDRVVAALAKADPGSEWTFEEVACAQQGATNHCAAYTLLHMLICLPGDSAVATAAREYLQIPTVGWTFTGWVTHTTPLNARCLVGMCASEAEFAKAGKASMAFRSVPCRSSASRTRMRAAGSR